jgi:hypothetical protein
MNVKKIGLSVLLLDFLGLTAYAVYRHGLVGIFELAFANVATTTLFVDLSIALSLVMVWMWRDAREHGISPLPYILVTLASGSVGPLLYLIRRPESAPHGARVGSPTSIPVGAAVARSR